MAVSEFDFGVFFVFVSPPSSASVAPRAYRARPRAERVGPPHATAVTTMSYGPTLVVHPELHTSGFGNQLGMLLQHLSIAALSHVQLVVPPLHVPVEHRQAPAFAEVLHADEVFNFSALSPLVNVTAFRRVPWLQWMAQHQEVVARAAASVKSALANTSPHFPPQLPCWLLYRLSYKRVLKAVPHKPPK